MQPGLYFFPTTPPKPIRWLAAVKLKPGGYFFSGYVMRYDKTPLSVEDQASLLQSRGLTIADPARARHYLTHIGYYRLSAYCLPFEQPGASHARSHRFLPGTNFDQVLALYIFDRKLRLLVMEALERVETAVRSHWANALAVRHGSHAHMQPELFKCPWQHAADIARLANDLKDSSETFVAHYRAHYSEPYLPPIWATVETLTLGALSRWFKSTRDTTTKREVAKSLGMPTSEILEQVLHALTPVRNICAHHGRLWNRRFTLQLPIIKRLRAQMAIDQIPVEPNSANCNQCGTELPQAQQSVQQQPSRQLFNYLVVMAQLMGHINPRSSWLQRIAEHIHTATAEQQHAMGFPENWLQRAPWNGLR